MLFLVPFFLRFLDILLLFYSNIDSHEVVKE